MMFVGLLFNSDFHGTERKKTLWTMNVKTTLHALFCIVKLKQAPGGASRETQLGQREDIKLREKSLLTIHVGHFRNHGLT